MSSQTPPLIEDLTGLRERIEVALRQSLELPEGCPQRLREAIAYSLLAPGKRLRPLLVLLAAEACGGSIEGALPAACAVEMVHAYSLIHDDLPAMDNDDLRRGRPTCHKQFGEAIAILAGDALLARAFEVLARGVEPPSRAAACCQALAEAAGAGHLVGGQADDIGGTRDGDLETLESIHARKTGAMIAVSLVLGGMTGGADPPKIEALARYGRCLGLAFQIVDDVLDVRGCESLVGKRLRKDSQAGKLTYPELLGTEASLRRAEELVTEACHAVAFLGPRATRLNHLARYVLERNR